MLIAIIFFIKIFYVNIDYAEIANQVKAEKTTVFSTEKSDEFRQAINKAQENINTFIEKLANKNPNTIYSVFTNFSEGRAEEHMWVIVQNYRDGVFYGYVKDEPQSLKNLKMNNPVEVKKEKVEDWIVYYLLTNTFEGNYLKDVSTNR